LLIILARSTARNQIAKAPCSPQDETGHWTRLANPAMFGGCISRKDTAFRAWL
jgi:hypothetical protein